MRAEHSDDDGSQTAYVVRLRFYPGIKNGPPSDRSA
jgi:hypothetical protein